MAEVFSKSKSIKQHIYAFLVDSWDYNLAYFDSNLSIGYYFPELIGQQLNIPTNFPDYSSLDDPPIFIININW